MAKPRKKKLKLTQKEIHILSYPPREGTWICQNIIKTDDSSYGCGMYNTTNSKNCSLCATPKPKKPSLLWPAYVEACTRAKITPGWKFRMKDYEYQRKNPKKGSKWETYDPNEEIT
jgi:hypothetical protein